MDVHPVGLRKCRRRTTRLLTMLTDTTNQSRDRETGVNTGRTKRCYGTSVPYVEMHGIVRQFTQCAAQCVALMLTYFASHQPICKILGKAQVRYLFVPAKLPEVGYPSRVDYSNSL